MDQFTIWEWELLVDNIADSLLKGELSKQLSEKGININVTSQKPRRMTKSGIMEESKINILAQSDEKIVAVIVHTDCNKQDVDHFLEVLQDFTRFFKYYKDKTIYGAMAYLNLQKEADKYAEEKGLFVIKATDESFNITNKPGFKPKDFSSDQAI